MEPHSCKNDAAVRKVEGGGASPPAAWQRLRFTQSGIYESIFDENV